MEKQLQAGVWCKAKKKRKTRDWICSLECKKKNNEVATFKDAQAAEKHIMREHPDPMYDKFVCLKDGCQEEKVSPRHSKSLTIWE